MICDAMRSELVMALLFIFGILFGIAGGGVMLDIVMPVSVFYMRLCFGIGMSIGVCFAYILYRVLD